MVLLCRTVVGFLALGLALAGCPDPVEPVEPPVERRSPAQVSLGLERGVISAAGTVREDTLTFRADRPGTVRIVRGQACEGADVLGNRAVAAGERATFPVRAEGALAEEGEYDLSACFTGQDQSTARAAVRLEVDNTPPVLSVTPLSGSEVCATPFVTFPCLGCATVAWSFAADISFGADLQPTSGTRYQGFAIPAPTGPPLYFRGVDRAGNQTALQVATYTLTPGQVAVTDLSYAVVSNNFNSNQRNTVVTLQGTPGSAVDIRWDQGACNAGPVIGTGTLNGAGTGTVTLFAGNLNSGLHGSPTATVEHPLRVCATAPAGCKMESTFTLSRKDAALGWTAEAPAGTAQAIAPWPAGLKLISLNAAVNPAAANPLVSTVVDNFYGIDAPVQLTYEPDGVQVDFATPLPENLRVDVQLSPSGLRDEAGNPLPSFSTFLNTGAGGNWHPFGQKTWTTTALTVTDGVTGLVWQRGFGSSRAWYQAHAYCHQLGTTSFAGRTDWRLPTARELASLADPDAPAGFPNFLASDFTVGFSAPYWSATAIPQTNTAWTVNFDTGALVAENRLTSRELRCVAGTPDGGAARALERVSWDGAAFVADLAGPIVRDPASGLYWEQAPEATAYLSAAAAAACDAPRHGLTTWQLPTSAHFSALHTLQVASPRLDLSAFTASAVAYHWVSRPAGYGLRASDASVTFRSFDPVWCVHQP